MTAGMETPSFPAFEVRTWRVQTVGKGRFTAGFLARLPYQKYVLGLPLHRVAKSLAADGFDVADWPTSPPPDQTPPW